MILRFLQYSGAFLVSVIVAGVIASVPMSAQAAGVVSTPTIISVQNGQAFSTGLPMITGVTSNNTRVEVTIDGVVNGMAKVTNDPSGTGNFWYTPFLALRPGEHMLSVRAVGIAMNADSTSESSETLSFRIWNISAPTLLAPAGTVEMQFSHPAHVSIPGLAKNDLTVNVHLDGVFVDHFKVTNNASGTANFAIRPDVAPGRHEVHTTASDSTGRISNNSNSIFFTVDSPLPAPTILWQTGSESTISLGGVAKNGSIIEVWIDGVKDGEVASVPHPSGTFSFAYTSSELVAGSHPVMIVAKDYAGKRSLEKSLFASVGISDSPSGTGGSEVQEVPKETEEPVVIEEPVIIEDPAPVEVEDGMDQEPEGEVEGETITEEDPSHSADAPDGASEEPAVISDEFDEGIVVGGDTDEVEVQPINWPLMLGVLILAFLVIVFIVWYFRQKQDVINKSIDRIFGETEADSTEGSIKTEAPKMVQEPAKKARLDPPLPPPPPPPPPSSI